MFAAGEIEGKNYMRKNDIDLYNCLKYTLSPMISLILLFQIFCYNVDHKKKCKKKRNITLRDINTQNILWF